MSSETERSKTTLKILLHAVFFLSGIATVFIGPALPVLAGHFALNDLQVSYFFPAQFSGSLLGTFLTYNFGKRNNFLTATLLGAFLMITGLSIMNFGSLPLCLLGFAINGTGIGLTLPSINMLILEMSPENAPSALNILNFFWGVGAIICSPFVGVLSKGVSIFWPTVIIAAALLVPAILIFFTPRGGEDRPVHNTETPDAPPPPIWSSPVAWLIALFNFIHVGFESGMGGWLPTYTGRVEGQPLVHWISPTLIFFLFFVLGRGVAPLFFKYLNENKMLILGLTIVLGGMGILLFAKNVSLLSVGAVVCGFGTSWIFPTNVSRYSKIFGPTATRRATPLFILGTLGAASTTWLIGFLSNHYNDLRSGMFVLLLSVVLLLIIQIGLSVRKPARE
jgi:fucose permease